MINAGQLMSNGIMTQGGLSTANVCLDAMRAAMSEVLRNEELAESDPLWRQTRSQRAGTTFEPHGSLTLRAGIPL